MFVDTMIKNDSIICGDTTIYYFCNNIIKIVRHYINNNDNTLIISFKQLLYLVWVGYIMCARGINKTYTCSNGIIINCKFNI